MSSFALAVIVTHDGVITLPDRDISASIYMRPERFPAPWQCGRTHEHVGFCNVDSGYMVHREFVRQSEPRIHPTADIATFVYRERFDPATMDLQQLGRRYEETEAKWLELGAKLDMLKAAIAARNK